jgi:hypothetical protein
VTAAATSSIKQQQQIRYIGMNDCSRQGSASIMHTGKVSIGMGDSNSKCNKNQYVGTGDSCSNKFNKTAATNLV